MEFMKTHKPTPLEQAVSFAGGVAQLAKACKVSGVAVYKWLKKGHPPIERCQAIERAVQGKVTRFDLLPPEFTGKRRRP